MEVTWLGVGDMHCIDLVFGGMSSHILPTTAFGALNG
jgi:hypothetical protein